MTSCAFGLCDNPACYLCYVLPIKFPPVRPWPEHAPDFERCRLVAGHDGPCRSAKMAKREER
jgi:hypothetical protein